MLAVTVADTGVGIGPEDLACVGRPFFQARASHDRRHGGTGLGLSIVKGLLALHGGELTIDSRPGEGTRVTFRLPVDGACATGEVERLVPRGDGHASEERVRKSA